MHHRTHDDATVMVSFVGILEETDCIKQLQDKVYVPNPVFVKNRRKLFQFMNLGHTSKVHKLLNL